MALEMLLGDFDLHRAKGQRIVASDEKNAISRLVPENRNDGLVIEVRGEPNVWIERIRHRSLCLPEEP